jgi:5-methylcytosine-specific restriction endonuclease McrA
MLSDFRGRICAICGEDDPRILMEAHHVFGRANGKEVLILCKNCHSKVTLTQDLLPPKKRSKHANEADRRSFEDASIGSLLELIGEKLKKRGLGRYGRCRKSV